MNEYNSKVKARRFVQLSSTYCDWSNTAHRLMSLILWDSNRRKADGFEPMTAAIVKNGSFKFYSHQESRRLAFSSGILKVTIGLTSSYYLGEHYQLHWERMTGGPHERECRIVFLVVFVTICLPCVWRREQTPAIQIFKKKRDSVYKQIIKPVVSDYI